MDDKERRWYRARRRSTIMKPKDYGQYLYLKHRDEIHQMIDESNFELTDKEKKKLSDKLFRAFWRRVGWMLSENIELSWGFVQPRSKRKGNKHYLGMIEIG